MINEKKKSFLKSNITRVLTSLIIILSLCIAGPFKGDGSQIKKVFAAGGTPKYGTMTVWRWDKVHTLPTDNTDSYYGFIMYDADGSTWFSNGSSGRDKTHWSSSKVSDYPYMSGSAESFYTRTRLSSPYFSYVGSDGDNRNCRKYKITLYNGNSSQARLNYTGFDIKRDWDNDKISVIDKDQLASKGGGSMKSGEFQMFYNTSGNDTVIFGRAGEFYGDGSGGGWPGTRFRIYRGTEITYSCLNNDFTIDPDQILIVDSNVVITEDATLTVPEGAVLVVKKGALFVNGAIELKGGTMLVEDGGIVMPFESSGNGCRIVIRNGGTMIVRSGGRVYAGAPKGTLMTRGYLGYVVVYRGGSIINYGLFACGQYDFFRDSIIENHKNAKMLLGYRLKSVETFLDYKYSTYTPAADLKLEADNSLGEKFRSILRFYDGSSFNYAIEADKGKADFTVYRYSNDGNYSVSNVKY
jgi:hypothetical protein